MDLRTSVVAALREQGALFEYVFGSVARGEDTPASDLDIAAFFPDPVPQSFAFDEVARVRWESTTRKIYLDERYRIERSHGEFLEMLNRG